MDDVFVFVDDPKVFERFISKVKVCGSGCWEWQGGLSAGYGVFHIGYTQFAAHRISYLWSNGSLTPGLQIDHLCNNKCCVNPKHLKEVTPQENTLRGTGPSAINATKIFCKNGHPLTNDNLLQNALIKDNKRICLICNRAKHNKASRQYYIGHREERLEYARKYRERT